MGKPKVLITGTSSGVGLSLTKHLSKKYSVIALARDIRILQDMENVYPYEIDLNNESELIDCLDQISSNHGFIPYVINNAGVMLDSSIEELSSEKAKESFQVNAFAPLIIMRKLLDEIKGENFGRIINVTSGAPLNCSENFSAYNASKGALNAFTVTAAKEYKSYNIKINLMSPGPCKTKMAPNGTMDPSVCHPTVEYLLNLDKNGPTGKFFWLGYQIPLNSDLEGIDWLKGTADERYVKVL